MSKWRAKAHELFPDIRPTIQTAATPGELWIELSSRLQKHYSTPPLPSPKGTSDFVRRVELYALWCHSVADWRTKEAVGIEFFESMLPFAIRSGKSVYDRVVEDLVSYLGVPAIKDCTATFGYGVSPQQLEHFLKQVDEAALRRSRRSAKK